MTKRYFIDQIVLNAGSPNFESLLDAMYDSLNQLAAVKLYIDQVRPIVEQYRREEITLGKCTEFLNELIQSTPSMTAEEMLKNKFNWDFESDPGRYQLATQLIIPAMQAFASSHQTGGYSEADLKEFIDTMDSTLVVMDIPKNRSAADNIQFKLWQQRYGKLMEMKKKLLSSLTKQGSGNNKTD